MKTKDTEVLGRELNLARSKPEVCRSSSPNVAYV